MPKIWVGRTTLNGEKKEDGLITLEDNPCNICYIGGILPFHTFFQLLTWTSLGNPVNTTEENTLKLVKLPSLKVIC